MADNIKIIGNIVNSDVVSRYSTDDIRLISSQNIQENFGQSNDYIEYYIYDISGNLLNINYNYRDFKLPSDQRLTPSTQTSPEIYGSIAELPIGTVSVFTSSLSTFPIIEIDPVIDLKNIGYSSGEFKVQYNFFTNRISNTSAELFIKEISADRTELRIGSTILSNSEIEKSVTDLINESTGSVYFKDYLLNFSNNVQVLAVNIALNAVDPNYEILFKLYEPLPLSINEKTSLWVVEEKVNPYVFDVNLDKLVIPAPPPLLRGPNFDIEIAEQGTIPTSYQNYNNLLLGLQSAQSSSYRQLLNLNATQSININVDYTDFNNFVFFSSAQDRIVNFYTKVKQIENYTNLINQYNPFSSSIGSFKSEINTASSSLNDIITNFDSFESFLYFESGSISSSYDYGVTPWPKIGLNKPYSLFSTASNQAISWSNSALSHSINYDLNNPNNLEYIVPSFIKDDTDNQNYLTFVNMIGHYFDNIWIYLKAVTDNNLANNNLNIGVSEDLVYNVLKSLGIDVYNSFSNQDLNTYLLGNNAGSGSYSGSLNDFSATSSFLNNIPRKDLLIESYKRIYHNLPLLLKQKGTVSGLNTFISTFGISNRDYYNIYSGSVTSSFYTPTGSVYVSSSIIGVKEFGGATKTELLAGYSNNKIRIVNTTVTGSVLSPYISVQSPISESSKFRSTDEHYVDISFSPQNQIDTYVSQSISASNPNWILDNYIGDPRQLYSGSYDDLITQKDIYFRQGTGSFKGFIGSLLDYNGFTRLIQYFDNSLFKMLKDYIPARANLSTGVTINSPVLERNKISYSRPNNSTLQTIYQSSISSSQINAQYGTLYNNLSGDKKAFYNGVISGSNVDLYNTYFIPTNENPYLGNFNLYNNQRPINQQIDLNNFYHSDFNITLNNIFNNRLSTVRRNIEYSGSFVAGVGSGSINIFTSASLQDSNLELISYSRPRYEGTKIYSTTYNTYTSASSTYGGDVSFGKTAVIDHYVRKLGLFTQIVSSSFLNYPLRNNVILKYLVDEFGGLTELNQRNKHWEEIQNTFKAGYTTAVSQFDNKKYSNQKTTDGSKPIFSSGYSYAPILYFSSSDSSLYFQYSSAATANLFHVNNTTGFITGSTTQPVRYQMLTQSNSPATHPSGNIYQIFDTADANYNDGNAYYINGSNSTKQFPTFSISQTGNYYFDADFGIQFNYAAPNNSSIYKFRIVNSIPNSGVVDVLASSTQTSNSSNASTAVNLTMYYNNNTVADGRGYSGGYYYAVDDRFTFTTSVAIQVYNSSNVLITTIPAGSLVYAVATSRNVQYIPNGCVGNSYNSYVSYGTTINYIYAYNSGGGFTLLSGAPDLTGAASTKNINSVCGGGVYISIPAVDLSKTMYTYPSPALTQTARFTVSTPETNLTSGSLVSFQLFQESTTTLDYTASLLPTGDGTIYDGLRNRQSANQAGNIPYATASFAPFISGSTNNNTLIFNNSLSGLKDYLYLPSTGSNSLYSTYGNVDYPFSPKVGDQLIIYYVNNTQYFECTISGVSTVNSKLNLQVSPTLPSLLSIATYTSTTVSKFILLTKLQDETNIILVFPKRDGDTSYGFVIPSNIAPDVLDNIDVITKEVKQKLLQN